MAKIWHKILVTSLVLVMVVSFAACAQEAEDEAGVLSAQDIVAGVIESLDDVQTYQFDMDMSMDATGEAEGEPVEVNMVTSVKGAFDLENKKLEMDMTMSTVGFGEPVEMSGEIYVIGDVVYTMTVDPELGSMWQKSEMMSGFWEELSKQMNQVESQIELLEAAQVEVIGSEKVGDVDCYVLKLTPDMAQLWQVVMQQIGVTGEEMLAIEEELLQKIFKSFSVKQWISKDTYFLTKAEIDMALELTPEAMGSPDEEGIVKMDIAMNLLAYNYNQPLSIELPPEAEEAIEMPMG